jgi:hypothetical protein
LGIGGLKWPDSFSKKLAEAFTSCGCSASSESLALSPQSPAILTHGSGALAIPATKFSLQGEMGLVSVLLNACAKFLKDFGAGGT